MKLAGLAAAVVAVFACAGSALAVDTGVYYRLSTEFRGPAMNLDVYNGGPKNDMTHLARQGDFSGQYWRLLDAGNGFYRLTTMFRGKNKCLDVYNGGARNNQVHLTDCANYSGQFWKISSDRGYHRLTTQFRGVGKCLDIFNGGPNNNQPHLTDCADFSGQYWSLEATDKPVVTGDNVVVARFKGGRWQSQGNGRWVEIGDNGGRFYFTEAQRDAESVYLDDRSRNIQVLLNVNERASYWSHDYGQFQPLYPLTELSD